MEVTFAEEYSAIHKGLLHYWVKLNCAKSSPLFTSFWQIKSF